MSRSGTRRDNRRPAPARSDRTRSGWARTEPIRAIRWVVQATVTKPLLHTQLQPDVGGLEEFIGLSRPVPIVANHASHLDTPLVLEALPADWRRRTGVAVTGDYLLNAGWRATASAVAFNTVAHALSGDGSGAPGELLDAGWNVLLFPEAHRSGDGYVGAFAADAAALAIDRGIRVLPVGIRGSYAAMPRGQSWPGARRRTGLFGRSRPRVSVRFGPALTPQADESAAQLTDRIAAAVRRLIAEDVGTWWQSQRDPRAGSGEEPPPGSWRRIWEQSQPPQPGGTVRRPRIWH